MSLIVIAAVAANRCIGKDNALIWHLSDDLVRFKKTTMGRPIIMGRKTFESLPKLLPGRTHYVLTGNPGYRAPEGVILFSSPEELLAALPEGDAFIIGGAAVYRLLLPYADKMMLTEIEKDYEGDAFFPDFDRTEWMITASEEGEGEPRHRFVTYERKK